MSAETETGRTALPNADLLNEVREYNLIAFRQAGKQFEKVRPGSAKLAPQTGLCAVIEKDYQDMQDMALKDAPGFAWVMSQIQRAETAINESVPGPERRSAMCWVMAWYPLLYNGLFPAKLC